MFERILAPLEGSALAECALPHAKAIAQAVGAQLLLLHVVEQIDGDRAPQVDPLDWYLQKAEAQSYISQLSRQWRQSNLSVSHALVEGPAAERVVAYAHDNDADLIVLSNQSQSGVAQKVIWQAGKSVMLVRAEWPTAAPDEMRYGRILLPLDGSLRAESVLPLATRLAQHCQADLLLAHIVARPDMVNRHTPTPEDSALIAANHRPQPGRRHRLPGPIAAPPAAGNPNPFAGRR
jgi:nucleotide-binding universal stress UspA family protein